MSFYGNIKRVNSSPFIFDKYYPNRVTMEANCTTDNIYIGRYVLVKYTIKDELDTQSNSQYFDKYVEDTALDSNAKKVYQGYLFNADKDINQYHDTYDGTIWLKIYTLDSEKYIMIAELNAAVPRLEFERITPKYSTGYDVENNPIEVWATPEINPTASSENAYKIRMPDILHLEVGDMSDNFYGKELIENPAIKKIYDIPIPANYDNYSGWSDLTDEEKRHVLALSPQYNYMQWKNLFNGEEATVPGGIDAKLLETKLYAFGLLISDLYDVLYGAPADGSAGLRPFYTDLLPDILSNYDKGLVGILTSIATEAKGDASEDLYGRTLLQGLYYYFVSKWCDATEDSNSFIENIPNVIGASTSSGGSGALSQLYIDFNNPVNGNYIKRF